MPKCRNVELNHLKSRLRHVNSLISFGKLSLLGHAICEVERGKIRKQILALEGEEEIETDQAR